MHNASKMISSLVLLGAGVMTGPLAVRADAPPSAALPGSAPAQQALTELAAAPNSPLPEGTQIRSVDLKDGLATVDFSRAFQSRFTGGDSAEPYVVNSVLKTLGRFPSIDRVQILVEGQRIDTLGGVLELSDPLDVIRSAPARPLYFHRRAHRAR